MYYLGHEQVSTNVPNIRLYSLVTSPRGLHITSSVEKFALATLLTVVNIVPVSFISSICH